MVRVEPSRLGRWGRQQVVAYLAPADDGVVYFELDFLLGLVRFAFEGVDDKLQVGDRIGAGLRDAGIESEQLDVGENKFFVEYEVAEGDACRELVGIDERIALLVGQVYPEEFELVEGRELNAVNLYPGAQQGRQLFDTYTTRPVLDAGDRQQDIGERVYRYDRNDNDMDK